MLKVMQNSLHIYVGGDLWDRTTVDYGPFGFIEEYSPGWGMWISSGNHFAFMNQPSAMAKNWGQFAGALRTLLTLTAASPQNHHQDQEEQEKEEEGEEVADFDCGL